MGIVQGPDAPRQVIDRQVAEGRAAGEAAFLSEAVRRYAAALERDSDAIVAAADEVLPIWRQAGSSQLHALTTGGV